MNIKEFYQLLSKNKITIDDNHHAFNLTRFIDNIKYQIEYYEELCKKHKNDKYFEQYYNILNRPINQFDVINVGYAGDGNIRCYYCNKPLCMVYLGDNNVVIINSEIAYNCSKTGEKISDYIHTSCSLSDITNKGYLETNIHVKNGQLVFANFFENEKLYDFDEDKRYKDETNICYVTGRNNLMQHLARKNVGYGQTGNMYIGVFVSNDKKSIIIAFPYDDEGEDNKIEGYKLDGKISCDVWRWQCADTSVLEKYGTIIDENFMEDNIVIEVPKGEWNIKHYYDLISDEDYNKNNRIIAVLTFIE